MEKENYFTSKNSTFIDSCTKYFIIARKCNLKLIIVIHGINVTHEHGLLFLTKSSIRNSGYKVCLFQHLVILAKSPGLTGPEFQVPHLSHEGPGLTTLGILNLQVSIIWYKNSILCHIAWFGFCIKYVYIYGMQW